MHGENGYEITAQCSAAREFGVVARENCCWAVKIPPAVRLLEKAHDLNLPALIWVCLICIDMCLSCDHASGTRRE